VLAHVGPVPLEQVPLVAPGGMSQVSPEQQSDDTVQLPVSATQLFWHRWDAGSQTPEQHCAFPLQPEPTGAQSAPHVWLVGSQPPKQHGCCASQAAPCCPQVPVATEHAQPTSFTSRHVVPVQHGSGDGALVAPAGAQIEPAGRQAFAAQRRIPLASGTHGANPQHWSRNWQMASCAMQHCGSFASHPVGHVVFTGPPKQRRIPFASGLHTALPLPPPS
jgi:hypothetical protein